MSDPDPGFKIWSVSNNFVKSGSGLKIKILVKIKNQPKKVKGEFS